MLRIHLGLGGNIAPRWAILGRAVERLAAIDPDLCVSPVYETAPVGGPAGQGLYLNAVVRLVADLDPSSVLELAAALEGEAERVRTQRWGPRTLDVDVLFLDEVDGARLCPLVLDRPELTVPHPRAAERAFVLAPLEDCTPELVPDGWRDGPLGAELASGAVRRVGEIVRTPAP